MRSGSLIRAMVGMAVGVSALALLPARAGEGNGAPASASAASASADAGAHAFTFADADAAMAYLEGTNWNGGSVEVARVDAAAEALRPAAEREPNNARWQTGLAMVGVVKKDMKAARVHAEKAIAADPKYAEGHYWLGNALFNDINNVGMLDKMSHASKGRKAYEKAIEADPTHVGARIGLIQFYLNAPGIAGGSVKKARELAKQLVAIPGGEVIGHLTLAQAAAKDGEHDEARSEFDAAIAACKDDADRRNVYYAQANSLLKEKKDPAAAASVIEKALPIAGDRETQARYLLGECKRQLKETDAAIEQFNLVLAKHPEAMNTRYALAQCYEAKAKWADAAREYDEFAKRFPQDERAGDASKAAKKMRKNIEKGAK